MPLYDFHCDDCETTFEELLKTLNDAGDIRCAKCGSRKVTRQIAVFSTGSSRQGAARSPSTLPARPSGGGCGSGCGCHS